MNISQRSYQQELLDQPGIPFEDIKRNMAELEFINKYLGGHNITLSGIKKILLISSFDRKKECVVCEIGCGGGDNMLAIHNWCRKNGIAVRFIGIDINPDCITVAVSKFKGIKASFISSDYLDVHLEADRPDIIFSSLFCHHFTNEALVKMLQWMEANARLGFFINDLHRHKLAYLAIKFLTKMFSRSYLVKNDAPLSVLRGFSRHEWRKLLDAAKIRQYTIQWKWAFRHLVTVNLSNKDRNKQLFMSSHEPLFS